jgi:hypothetical protein
MEQLSYVNIMHWSSYTPSVLTHHLTIDWGYSLPQIKAHFFHVAKWLHQEQNDMFTELANDTRHVTKSRKNDCAFLLTESAPPKRNCFELKISYLT